MDLGLPLIWFFGVGESRFQAIFPVYLIAEEAQQHQFVVDIDAANNPVFNAPGVSVESMNIVKGYTNRLARVRLHQRVLGFVRAARLRVPVCRLQFETHSPSGRCPYHSGQGRGRSSVQNGLALCKIHHAAFDAKILGIRPDLTVHIRDDILAEVDGPMLKHGLQERHNQKLMSVPTLRAEKPDGELLARSYAGFLKK